MELTTLEQFHAYNLEAWYPQKMSIIADSKKKRQYTVKTFNVTGSCSLIKAKYSVT